jgi:hypothetical protein
MKTQCLWIPLSLLCAALAAGCSSARDVEVTGEVQAASGVQTSGKIRIEVFDVSGDGESAERTSLDLIELDALGPFEATVSAEGEKLLVRAIADADANGACSAGEPWAEQELPIAEDGTVEPVTLQIAAQACPTE